MKTRFRPSNLTSEKKVESLGIEIFYNDDLRTAIFYAGKSMKPVQYYRYESAEVMHKKIDLFINNRVSIQEAKEKRAQELKEMKQKFNAAHYFNEGDVVVNSWGYEQTNINFYQVVRITNRQIEVKAIGSKQVEGSMYSHGMACEVLPVKDAFIEDGDTFKLGVKPNSENSCYLTGGESYYHFSKHDGKPEYKSWYY